MFVLFSVAIIVIVGLVVFMFFILKSTVKQINSQTKLYFVDKLQEYDHMINKKEEKLNYIKQELEKHESKSKETINNEYKKNTYEFDYQIIELLNKTEYQNNNIYELNKKIDEKFNIDYIGLLNKFLEYVKDDGTYEFCLNLKNKFNSELIYNLKLMTNEEQATYLKKILTNTEYLIYNLYIEMEKYPNIDGLISYLEELIDLNNPSILVYVGSKSENYNSLSKYIKTIYSKDIYKGIRIIYKKQIYDYSLNERNV